MAYLRTREVAAIAVAAALWGVLNALFSPIIFSLTGLPILCDLIGFTVLSVAAWWIHKLGALTAIGLIATAVNFMINPQAVIFLGFTVASAVYDVTARLAQHKKVFQKPKATLVTAIAASTLSGAIAGIIIATFFMVAPMPGGTVGWAMLHAAGGLAGGTIGGLLINMLVSRRALSNTPN